MIRSASSGVFPDNATDSDTCIVLVELSLPAAPTGLDAELVKGSLADVKLTWTASGDDGAGDGDVTTYNIYKSTNGVNGAYNLVDSVTAQGIPTYEWTDSGAGDGDWNNYFYIVRAEDGHGNEEQNTNKVGKFVSLLDDDWNLFSVPCELNGITVEELFSSNISKVDFVYGYDNEGKGWTYWINGLPPASQTLNSFEVLLGYWAEFNESFVFTVN